MTELGEALRVAREKRGLTIADVSRETRIKESFLEALENGEYSNIPGPAYVTGFLRNYARVVGLHPDDVVEEFHAERPIPQPTVKAATKVLANGHMRDYRRRILWGLGGLVVALGGAFTVKQYSDQYLAHASAPPLNVTPANTGVVTQPVVSHKHVSTTRGTVKVRLRAVAPVLVHVTVDGKRVFTGLLQPGARGRAWTGNQDIYVLAYNGSLVRGTFNGHSTGLLAHSASLVLESVTASGWQRVS